MASHPLSPPQSRIFAASRLPLLLRAISDPEGKREISATIHQIETNLAHHAKHARPRRRKEATAPSHTSFSQPVD